MDQQIATLRERFEAELQLSSAQNAARFHPIDISRVRTEDWQVKRYILDEESGDLEAAYKALVRTLEWKCKWGVHENRLSQYPQELFDLYSIEAFEEGDREGRLVFAEVMRGQRRYPELDQHWRAFVIAWAEHLDRRVGERGLTYLVDFTGSSLLKIDFGLTKFRTGIISRHYPLLLKRSLMHRVPKAVAPPLKLAYAFFKKSVRDVVTYTADLEGLFAYVDPARLHTDYGGRRTELTYPPGEELQSLWTLYPAMGLERKFVERFLREAQAACKKELINGEDDGDEEEKGDYVNGQ